MEFYFCWHFVHLLTDFGGNIDRQNWLRWEILPDRLGGVPQSWGHETPTLKYDKLFIQINTFQAVPQFGGMCAPIF